MYYNYTSSQYFQFHNDKWNKHLNLLERIK